MKRLKIIFFIALTASGCSTTKSVSNIEIEQEQTSVFKIQAGIIGGDATRITSEYANALVRSSSYRSLYWERDITSGVRGESTINSAKISYVHQNERGTLKNNFNAIFPLNIARTDDMFIVSVNCPTNVTNDLSELSGLPWTPFISKEKVIADVKSICRRASFVFPVIESGEINTSFNDSSVFPIS